MPDPSPEERRAGLRAARRKIPALLQFGFWMAVVIAVTLVAMNFTLKYFDARDAPWAPACALCDRQLPPSPRLQVDPHRS